MKVCPACTTETSLGTKFCDVCGYEFPKAPPRFKPCPKCEAANPLSAKTCQNCGESFAVAFTLTLDEALRTGAIVRGMDIDEQDVVEGEEMANSVRSLVMKSGDEKLVKVIKQLPEESWARLKKFLSDKP